MTKRGTFQLMRKVHRALAIPMVVFVILKLTLSSTSLEPIIFKVTSVTMLLMVITGIVIYFMTIKKVKI